MGSAAVIPFPFHRALDLLWGVARFGAIIFAIKGARRPVLVVGFFAVLVTFLTRGHFSDPTGSGKSIAPGVK